MIQQLNGQTQRLLGQQSLAAYTGLRVDVDRIRIENETRKDAMRKAGLIIYDGPTLTKAMKAELREEALRKYGLDAEQLQQVDEQLVELVARRAGTSGCAGVGPGAGRALAAAAGGDRALRAGEAALAQLDPQLAGIVSRPLEELQPQQLVQLLQRMRNRLACMVDNYRERQQLPAREGPRWEGEASAAALLKAVAAAVPCAASGPAGDGLSAGAPAGTAPVATAGSVLDERDVAVAVARGRHGIVAVQPQNGASGSSRKRSKAAENAGPSGATAGTKRKAGGGSGVEGAPAARRTSRAKRPTGKRAASYDPYIDDSDEGPAEQRRGATNEDAALRTLTGMGFTPRKARGALQDCDFNVEAAVEWLFANCV